MLEVLLDKIARERIFVIDGCEAPEWRAGWLVELADPPALMGG